MANTDSRPAGNQPEHQHNNNFSYADVHGEWEERKIPLLGPVKSLISQLRVGQDMTKVSLPSILLRPYSMVEEFGSRTLGHVPLLYKSSSQTDPQERMLTVVNWILSTTRDENFNHKPFNSIFGETHVARLNHSNTTTYFFGEQISHHPPVTAFLLSNQEHKIKVTGTYSFSIKFAPNTIFVTTEGRCEINLGDEVYIMDKSLPDMIIKNSIIGKKAVAWTGKISISCPRTSWHADLEYHLSKDLVKYVEGTIICLERSSKSAQSLYISGRCGGTIYKSFAPISLDKLQNERETLKDDNSGSYYGIGLLKSFMESTGLTPETKPVVKKSHKKSKSVGNTSDTFHDVLIDFTDQPELVPEYPDLEKLPLNSSRVVWKEVAEHIVNNDMDKADEAKLRVEESQRIQRSREMGDSCGGCKGVYFIVEDSSSLAVRVNEEILQELPRMFES